MAKVDTPISKGIPVEICAMTRTITYPFDPLPEVSDEVLYSLINLKSDAYSVWLGLEPEECGDSYHGEDVGRSHRDIEREYDPDR